jgi:hypothetical protein
MRLLDDPEQKEDGTVLLGLRQVLADNTDRYVGIEFSREEAKEYGGILIEAASHV